MTTLTYSAIGASSTPTITWESINWTKVIIGVKKLQMRIAKAVRERRYGKVKALQWILTHSFTAKLLAVKRVTQNQGKNTPGVDGLVWRTPQQKIKAVQSLKRRGYCVQPLRRVWIPKRAGKKRPLGIPTMKDRAMQALYLQALEPVSESILDRHAYGFRHKRSAADAIDQCFKTLCQKVSAPWILEADIKSCYDSISHAWLLEHCPMDKKILKKWLTAGYMDKNTFYITKEGTPQGGIISPTLMNITLRGLEKTAQKSAFWRDKVNTTAYADDFIITERSKEVLENKVKPAVCAFLKERGLEFSVEKTKITSIDEGFDFLGFTIRKYQGKLLIMPSKASIKEFLKMILETMRLHSTITTEQLIYTLNPKIRGWTNYYRHVVSKKVFNYVDHKIFGALLRWIKRRHPNKNFQWRKQRYFCTIGNNNWTFFAKSSKDKGQGSMVTLMQATSIPIVRHVKIRADANPYDPKFNSYFFKRNLERKKYQHCIKEK